MIKHKILAAVLALVMTSAMAASFIIGGEDEDDEPQPVMELALAGKLVEGKEAVHKMVRTEVGWTQSGDPLVNGYILSEYRTPQLYSSLRSVTYFCTMKTGLLTSITLYGKDSKQLKPTMPVVQPINVEPNTLSETELIFFCDGIQKKACTAKGCV